MHYYNNNNMNNGNYVSPNNNNNNNFNNNNFNNNNNNYNNNNNNYNNNNYNNNNYNNNIIIDEREFYNLKENLKIEKNKNNILQANVNKLKAEYKKLVEKYNNMEGNSQIEKNNNNILQANVNKLNAEYEKLKANYNMLEKSKSNEMLKLEKENSKLKEENKKLKDNLSSINEEKKKLEININTANENYKKEKIKLNNDLSIKEQKINTLINELKKEVKKNEDLQKDIVQKSSKFDGAINQFQRMSDSLKSKNEQLQELKSKFNELQKTKENYEELKKIKDKEIPKEEKLKAPAEQYYDAIVDISSISSLKNDGWKIYYNKERKEEYQRMVGEETLKLGVLGLNNVGKSFILSKLANAELPSGYSIETKGISIKYSKAEKGEEKGLCILDSAGFETPLLKEEVEEINKLKEEHNNNNNEFEQNFQYGIEDELSRDKAQIERFIEQLIISLSDMIILVIGKMTRTEQRLITKIKNLIRKKEINKIKSLIIIHNLSHYYYNSEVENYIQQYLKRSATFKLEQRQCYGIKDYEDKYYFVEKHSAQNDFEVFHYIMGKEGEEAGNTYNELTMRLIKHQYNNCNIRRKIDIPEEIIKLFAELSPEILGEKREVKKSNENEDIIKLTTPKESEKKEANKMPSIQAVYMDQDGNYYDYFDGKYVPKYSLYYYKEKIKRMDEDDDDEDDEEEKYQNILLLRVELPGNIKKLTALRSDVNGKSYGIILKGFKEDDQFPERKNKDFTIVYDNRKYKEFKYFIKLDKNCYCLSEAYAKGATKTYTIDFNKKNKEDNENKENKENRVNKEKKEIKLEKIQCGVYVMKFLLID